jgi:flagellar biosynthetic protein FliR
MITLHLGQQLSGHVFPFMLVFTRLGAAMMLFPGIGESFVTPRIRLLFALLMSLLLFPVLMPDLPPAPDAIASLFRLIAQEALIGVFFGSFLRFLVSAIETSGAIIAVQMGLSNAMILNPTQGAQSALPSAFLSMAAVTILFMTGLDHFLLRALADTYSLFPAKATLVAGDMTQSIVHTMSSSFAVGLELAAPFLVIGLMLYVALGFVQRLVPQVQLFLVVLPLQIWGSLLLFAAVVGVMLTVWLHYFDESLNALGQ